MFDIRMEGKQMIEAPVSRLIMIFIVLIMLGGCGGSKSANYYILRSIQDRGPGVEAAGPGQEPAIGVGPVKIADYLNRPQIVSRSSNSGLQFAEFDRWAEPLEKNLTRVLADNLTILLPSERVAMFPWPESLPVLYQITLEIIHLERMPDEKVILDASWNILGNNGEKLLMMKRTRLILPVQSAGYEGIASTESSAVETLSREIAAAIKSLHLEASQ